MKAIKLDFKASIKHVQISQANNVMLIVAGVACVVVVFSLLSAKALMSESGFQHNVLKQRNVAVSQLKNNLNAAKDLKTQYDVFENENPNIIGGEGGAGTNGNGPSDGDNARIVLDALPSQYDFPALTSSIEKIVNNDNVPIEGIGGTDNGSQNTPTASSQQSQPVPIAFTLSVQTDYKTSLTLIKDFERSIRPFDASNLSITGTSDSLTVSMQFNTYYQPAVSLQIGQKEITQ